MRRKKTVAVFFGGNSYEREISIITGLLSANLLKEDYSVLPVYLSEENECFTSEELFSLPTFEKEVKRAKKICFFGRAWFYAGSKIKRGGRVDAALNCCHSGAGEDGRLSGFCSFLGIPLASPKTAESAIFMDKIFTKYLCTALKVPTADFFEVRKGEELPDGVKFPCIVKPARLGSSVGITVLHSQEEWEEKKTACFSFDDKLILEEYFERREEVVCAAYRKNEKIIVSEPQENFSGEGVFTYEKKYGGEIQRKEVSNEIKEEISSLTRLLYEKTDCFGIVRADFFVVEGKVLFNEMNAVPGSLAFGLFTNRLSEQKLLLSSLIEEAVSSPKERKISPTKSMANKLNYTLLSACKR